MGFEPTTFCMASIFRLSGGFARVPRSRSVRQSFNNCSGRPGPLRVLGCTSDVPRGNPSRAPARIMSNRFSRESASSTSHQAISR